MAACAAVAFLSLLVQVRGLVGERGILPAELYLERVRAHFDDETLAAFARLPGVHWLVGAGDTALIAMCILGILASLLVVARVLPGPLLLVCYVLYLSLCHCGQVFLGYQWDMLLCEALLAAALLSPWGLRPGFTNAPARLPLLVVVALAARLDFGSALSKLASHDVTWRSLTALTFHYETQPLPTPLGWLVYHLPAPIHVVTCALMFAIQLGAPPLLLVPWRRVRHAAVLALALLQIGIALTGNYAFFNALTIILALAAVDDDAFVALTDRVALFIPRALKRDALDRPRAVEEAPASTSRARLLAVSALALSWLPLGVCAEIDRLTREPMPEPIATLMDAVAPFQIAGGYGLFATMTTARDEINVECTVDGTTWLPIVFAHKPGDVDELPGFVAPHQPRLDWQMWFAALGTAQHNPWLVHFLDRLLEREPTVLALIDNMPCGDDVVAVRAQRYRYRIAPLASPHKWTHEFVGPYAVRTKTGDRHQSPP
ncbi:MAG TPA: lipase maturation factor family protein [Myxococcota bacterium]